MSETISLVRKFEAMGIALNQQCSGHPRTLMDEVMASLLLLGHFPALPLYLGMYVQARWPAFVLSSGYWCYHLGAI